jgi:hypothetical protein
MQFGGKLTEANLEDVRRIVGRNGIGRNYWLLTFTECCSCVLSYGQLSKDCWVRRTRIGVPLASCGS